MRVSHPRPVDEIDVDPFNIMSGHRLEWSCEDDMVSAIADAAMHRTLVGMSWASLERCYETLEFPTIAGMPRRQSINLLRHVMRDRSPEGFDALAVMGSATGAKEVAEVFETALKAYLAAMGVPFKDEAQQKKEWRAAQPRSRGRQPALAFVAAGREIGGQKRPLYSGPCADCRVACTVPFKPVRWLPAPKCRDCLVGGSLLTLDVLFSEPTFINGKPVHWLDCKAKP